ncbi:glycoside hydrolase family 19 protein [Cupriavidus sp. 30B13]|uniref:glycoside hydrolase family 19 protein n=1 Tax=Cupriavidus sp. 30B13 TaxID=3384241 RepID=UPI003B8FD82A
MTTTPTNPPSTPVKLLRFAFPFRKKAQGNGTSPVDFTDEHEIHRLLKGEPSGAYAVSGKGMWHGGIHVTEATAGQALDLKHGVLCIADGEVVAWRLNRVYPVSEIPAQDGRPAIHAPYSTGFALVRHAMEFPKDTKLTFFSLYMHLQDLAGYEADATLDKPAYLYPEFKVTAFAQDRPQALAGQTPPAGQIGLRVRASHPHGTPLCILPQGTQIAVSKREGNWGKIKAMHGAQVFPPIAGGFAAPSAAVNGWVFLGKEHGGHVVERAMPESSLDRVVVPSPPFPIKAGELIGHLGRYDSLTQPTSNRQVHIEAFCGDDIKTFLDRGRAWISINGPQPDAWKQLGLPSDPTILRVDKRTTLYKAVNQPGQDAPQTDVIHVVALAELAKHAENQYTETTAGSDGMKLRWWKIDSADVLRHDISGWVREQNFAGGRVTREFAQKWVDFETFDDPHDQTHTIFATTNAYVDYRMGADVPERASLGKLSPLMTSVYSALYPSGDPSRAADELCTAAEDPWRALRMSRLIIKHESEWANPEKWKQLVSEIEERTGQKAQHEAEQERIEKLVWWDEVKAGVADLPGSSVFHIHPIGLVGNFQRELQLITIEMLTSVNPNGSRDYHEGIIPALNKYAKGYFVTTPKRIAHFLSQISVESGFMNVGEDLKYSSRRMKEVFGCRPVPHGNHTPKYHIVGDDVVCNFGQLRTKLWTEAGYYSNNAEHLGNYVYENRYGNGPESSGDGYKYRGRGLIQTTFKANYEIFNNEHNVRFPGDQHNFVENPDLLLNSLEYGIESAFVYWAVTRNINAVADDGNVLAVTKKVNGGTIGLAERRDAYNRVAPLLGLPMDES